jgi:multidrug efflux pump subunit AcrB
MKKVNHVIQSHIAACHRGPVFWGPMAYAVMRGLAVATLLTLVFCRHST